MKKTGLIGTAGTALAILLSILPLRGAQIKTIPIPIAAYSETTSLMMGGMLRFLIQEDEADTRYDTLQVMGLYTLENQTIFNSSYRKYFAGDKVVYRGSLGYVNFPSNYYGIGPDTPDSAEEEYRPVTIPLRQYLLFNVHSIVYVGPEYIYKYSYISRKEEGGLVDAEDPSGGDPVHISMPGIRLQFDSRNDRLFPSGGCYLKTAVHMNSEAFGATQNFQRGEIDYRRYINLYRHEYVLGFQGLGVWQHGDVPLDMMESLGGSHLLRGYDRGRYRDKSRYGIQTELRHPYPFFRNNSIGSRFSGTLFIGAAAVDEEPADFTFRYTRIAGGAGIRYRVTREEKLNMRADFSGNMDGGFNFYFSFMEAF